MHFFKNGWRDFFKILDLSCPLSHSKELIKSFPRNIFSFQDISEGRCDTFKVCHGKFLHHLKVFDFFYRNSVGCLLVYDVCNRESFTHIPTWMNEAKRHIEPHKVKLLFSWLMKFFNLFNYKVWNFCINQPVKKIHNLYVEKSHEPLSQTLMHVSQITLGWVISNGPPFTLCLFFHIFLEISFQHVKLIKTKLFSISFECSVVKLILLRVHFDLKLNNCICLAFL